MSNQKIHIPSSEIKHPNGYHSDSLGFTFRWKGHFLRGILPESADFARRYFDSGFVDEICGKGMFPKTWISDFENEEFAFIIEHEMMTPLLYATDWNFSMLRDASALVLEIAKTAKKYGYNMIDCHKLNVMFKYGRPMYVDLGSFIPYEEGSSAWRPYLSFLRSYYYILDIWHKGAGQIAKRSMTPGVEFNLRDYHLFKNPLWRMCPGMMERIYDLRGTLHAFATTSLENIRNKSRNRSNLYKRVALSAKKIINLLKPVKSQRQCSLDRMRCRIQRMTLSPKAPVADSQTFNEEIAQIINKGGNLHSATIFECNSPTLLSHVLENTTIESMIAVHENEYISESIYKAVNERQLAVTCTYYQISEGGLLIRGRYPEDRFKSDVAIALTYKPQPGLRGVHSSLWFIHERMLYSSQGKVIFMIPGSRQDIVEALSQKYDVKPFTVNGGTCVIIEEKKSDI